MTKPVPFLDVHAMTADVRVQVDYAWRNVVTECDFVRGEAVTHFEQEWAAYCDTQFAVGVANGTDAIELTLTALGIGAGDEVVVPANTFVGTVEAIVRAGARPRFADVDPGTLLISADTLADALTPRVRAVVVVHLFGQVADMDAIEAIARSAGILVVEDAAQAHGARWSGRRAGSFGIAGCFSFYPGKNLGAFGDAGAVVTSNRELADRIRSLGDHGRSTDRYHHDLIGTNSRLDTIQAAVLSAKLPYLERWNRSRAAMMGYYRELLDGVDVTFVESPPESEPVYHLGVVQVAGRDEVQRALHADRIATAVHYPIPCHELPPYREFRMRELPVVETAARRILSLPLFPHLSGAQAERVADSLRCAAPRLTVSHG